MPGSEGVYSILEGGVKTNDVQFEQIYAQARELKRKDGRVAPAPGTSVNLAVLDSGVVTQGDPYYEKRMAASGSAIGGVGVQLTRGLPATEGQHGTHCASIAASGTTMIKIIDVQVGRTQEGGKVDIGVWTTAFKWAIQQGARIVNVSVVCPWHNPGVSSLVESNSGVLFLATSGNGNTEFTAGSRKAQGTDKDNLILVAGCARNGDRQDQRGYGAGIDVFVPSVNVPGHAAKRFLQEIYFKRDSESREKENKKLDPDRQNIAKLELQIAQNPPNVEALKKKLLAEQKRLAMGEKRLPQVSATAAEYPIPDEALGIADSGVSFGIPMVANVAAKMMLLMPNLTPQEIIALMKQSAEQCAAGGVLDPVRCYQAALEKRRQWAQRI